MYLLLLPSALLICAVVIYPTLYGMQLSFREMRLNRPDLGTDWVRLQALRSGSLRTRSSGCRCAIPRCG
jgi:ABC-type sugar transport system permease subunit